MHFCQIVFKMTTIFSKKISKKYSGSLEKVRIKKNPKISRNGLTINNNYQMYLSLSIRYHYFLRTIKKDEKTIFKTRKDNVKFK